MSQNLLSVENKQFYRMFKFAHFVNSEINIVFFKRNIYNIYHSQEIWKNVWVESLWKCLSAGRQVFSAVEGWQVNVQHINGWTLAHDTYRCIIGVFEELWTMKNWFVRMYLCKFNLYSPFQSEDFDHWCSIIYHMILNSNASIITKAANTLLLVNF